MHNAIGKSNPAIKKIPITAPITSVIKFFFSVFKFTCVFFFIANRLRRITAAQFLNAFYFIFKVHRSSHRHCRTMRQGGVSR